MTDVRPAFVFLREFGEDNNSALARCAEEILASGPMSWELRQDEHIDFLEQTLGRGRQLLTNIHTGPGTECAVFVGACAIAATVIPTHGWPKTPAITTWTGFGGFGSKSCLIYKPGFEFIRGDVLYWCGNTKRGWQAALNGHVGIARYGEGHMFYTAEGGGGADGTVCKLSAEAKDITVHSGRPLRCVWRPNRLEDE